MSADTFVDSVGVNIHLHYTDTPYGDFPAVRQAIESLGIHHVREGMIDTKWQPFYDRLNELGRAGIKATFITSPKQSAELLTDYPKRVPTAFEAYEAPNEFDISGDANWSATLNAFLPVLYKTVKSNAATRSFPIVGPSLTQASSYPKLAGAQQYFDYSNLHNYMGGRNPGTPGWGANGFGSYQWHLDHAQHTWLGKPIITTETGYLNDLGKANAVPEKTAGKYMPRLLFEQTLHDIKRTYVYELIDTGHPGQKGDTTFGLLHADFSPKPAFVAVQNVLKLLADPGPEFHTGSLEFTLSGDLHDVHHLLFEKRDGVFYLAIWIERPSYEVGSKKQLNVAEQEVDVRLGPTSRITRYLLNEDGQMLHDEPVTSAAYKFKVSDCVTILQMSQQTKKQAPRVK